MQYILTVWIVYVQAQLKDIAREYMKATIFSQSNKYNKVANFANLKKKRKKKEKKPHTHTHK